MLRSKVIPCSAGEDERFGVKADAAESRRTVRVALCRLSWSFMLSGVSASRSRTVRSGMRRLSTTAENWIWPTFRDRLGLGRVCRGRLLITEE
jgi:hypothetical protein